MTTLTAAKVITQHGPRDFDATFDGNYIGSFTTRRQAELALNDHVLDLCMQGLITSPLAALEAVPDGTPVGEDIPPADGEPGRCPTCNGSGLIPSNGCGDACGGWAEHCPDCRSALAVA